MAEPDWDRWHELLDLRDGRGLTPGERLEYERLLKLAKRLDKKEADMIKTYNQRSKQCTA